MPLPIIETLGEKTLRAMLEGAQKASTYARQQDAARRLLIMQGNWKAYVLAYIERIYQTKEVRKALSSRVKTTISVLEALAERTCVAYERPPVRRLAGASTSANDAWQTLMREASIRTQAKAWERMAFAMNVVIVVPEVVDLELRYTTIYPHCCEMYFDDRKGFRSPVAIVYSVKDPSDVTPHPLRTVVLDDQRWRYYDDKGKLEREIWHNAGVFPGVIFRLRDPLDNDVWDSHRGDGLVDATIEVAHLAARLDWVRHDQDRFKEVLVSPRLSDIPVQTWGAGGALEIPGLASDFDWRVVNTNTPPASHIDHINFHVRAAAWSVGVPSALVDFYATATNVSSEVAAQQHLMLETVRLDRWDFLEASERELAWKTSLVLRGMRHPLASTVPPDLVRERFEVIPRERPFIDHPEAQGRVWKLWIELGLLSTQQAYEQAHPGVTPEEAQQRVEEIAEQEARLNELYITRGLPRDPELRRQSHAQLLGTIGGIRSGEQRDGRPDPDAPKPPNPT